MTPRTNILLSVTGQAGAVAGQWFSPPSDDRLYIPIEIILEAGTCTWILEGTNSAAVVGGTGTATQIDTGSASKSEEVQRFKYFRFRLSAATGAQVIARTDKPMRQAS